MTHMPITEEEEEEEEDLCGGGLYPSADRSPELCYKVVGGWVAQTRIQAAEGG